MRPFTRLDRQCSAPHGSPVHNGYVCMNSHNPVAVELVIVAPHRVTRGRLEACSCCGRQEMLDCKVHVISSQIGIWRNRSVFVAMTRSALWPRVARSGSMPVRNRGLLSCPRLKRHDRSPGHPLPGANCVVQRVAVSDPPAGRSRAAPRPVAAGCPGGLPFHLAAAGS